MTCNGDISEKLAFLYQQKNTDLWLDVSSQVKHLTLTYNNDSANQLLEFNFEIGKELVNDNNETMFIYPGDKFAVTQDNTYQRIHNETLYGIVTDPKVQTTGGWNYTENRPNLKYSPTVRQIDFSGNYPLNLEYKTETEIFTILTAIFENAKTGGYLSNGILVPKFNLLSSNILIAAYETNNYNLRALLELINFINHRFKIRYVCEPDPVNLIRILTTVDISDSNGVLPKESSFSSGITVDSIKFGKIANPDYGKTANPNEPKDLFSETNINVEYDFYSILNSLKVIALVQNDDNLTREILYQDEKPQDSFNLKYKYRDIKYIARYLKSDIISASSNSNFEIESKQAEKIENYDQLHTDLLVCRIEHKTTKEEYFREFVILNGIVNLVLNEEISSDLDIPDLITFPENYRFELIKSMNVLEDNRENLDGYPFRGVVFNIGAKSNASIKFMQYDIPKKQDTIIVYGHKLEEYEETWRNIESMETYGVFHDVIELDTPLTSKQIKLLRDSFEQKGEPLQNTSFDTSRPETLQTEWNINFNIPGLIEGIFSINSINNAYKGRENRKQKPNILQNVRAAKFRNEFSDVLSDLRNKNNLKRPTQTKNEFDIKNQELELTIEFEEGTIETTNGALIAPYILPSEGLPSGKSFLINSSFDGTSFDLIDFSGNGIDGNVYSVGLPVTPTWVTDAFWYAGINNTSRLLRYPYSLGAIVPDEKATHILVFKSIGATNPSEVFIALSQTPLSATKTYSMINNVNTILFQVNYRDNAAHIAQYVTPVSSNDDWDINHYFALGWTFDRISGTFAVSYYDFNLSTLYDVTSLFTSLGGNLLGDLANFASTGELEIFANIENLILLRYGTLKDSSYLTQSEMNDYLVYLDTNHLNKPTAVFD